MTDRFRVSRLVIRQLQQYGISEVAVLRKAGLGDAWLRQEKIVATTEELFAFWRAVADVSGDPTIGLRIGPAYSAEGGTPQTIAALHSESFRDAVERMGRYKKLTCPEEILLTRKGDESAVEFRFTLGGNAEPPVLVDICLSWIMAIGQRGSGAVFHPLRLELMRPAKNREALEEHFGCRVKFGAERNALVFRSTELDRPFITHNPELLELLIPQLDAALKANEPQRNVVEEVKSITKRLLAGRRPTLADIARNLGTSTRSLQRQLTELRVNFQQLLQEVRRELAQLYLTQETLELNEVAYLVGFDDPNSFFRAFQRWEGVSPFRWRRHRLDAAPAEGKRSRR